MRPYYDEHGITIYHGDCREVLSSLAPQRFDMVLTDAPYSDRTHNGARTNRIDQRSQRFIDFESMTAEELDEVFALCASWLDGWFVSFVDWRHVARLDSHPPSGLRFVRFGIWDKPNGTPQISGDRPAMGWKAIAILHTSDGRMKWNGGGRRAVWTCLRESHCSHRTQKPLSLVRQLSSITSSMVIGLMMWFPFARHKGPTPVLQLPSGAVFRRTSLDSLNLLSAGMGQPIVSNPRRSEHLARCQRQYE